MSVESPASETGTINVSAGKYAAGDTVTVNVTPETDYILKDLYYVETGAATEVKTPITSGESGYSFKMPEMNVTVKGTFVEKTYVISGTVSAGSTGATVEGITITLDDGDATTTDDKTATVNAGGTYSFVGVAKGNYTLKIEGTSDYDAVNQSVTVSNENVTKNITLEKGV